MLGMRRAGKSSIQQVLFNNLAPKQTFYLESTMRIVKHTYDTIIPLEIWDCPGNISVDKVGASLAEFSAVIFVIDIRDVYNQPISKLVEFITAFYDVNPTVNFEVFVHKAEKLQDDDKYENFRQINERVNDRLYDLSADYEQLPLNFHLTSIYDSSLHEAFSRVIHKLVDSLAYLEHLLNVFIANIQCPKAYLYDVKSCLYIATDASPVDAATHSLSCEFIKLLNTLGPLYTSTSGTPIWSSDGDSALSSSTSVSSGSSDTTSLATKARKKALFYPSAATTTQTGTTVTYHLITEHLALLSLLPTVVYESRRGIVEYNVVFLREGVQEICDAEKEARIVDSGTETVKNT
ncbi:Gtr1/RagA G protein conserved region-domain-containing protein [Pterulicium gracile]|uniref:GTP-binding protein n=1 Tax=Pterulicium gracile TaxID=1884261 RepID=A0A5C3Q9B4_9AGAR|nr:Gtr1/RagA G protein conserved region-domain-containing protein [Pterula gracilis]